MRFRLCGEGEVCNTLTDPYPPAWNTNFPLLVSSFDLNAPSATPSGEVEDYHENFFPTGVTLGNFEVKAVNEHIEIDWNAVLESNVFGYTTSIVLMPSRAIISN